MENNKLDYININKIIDICDYVIFPADNLYFKLTILKKGGIIFCKFEELSNLFKNLSFSNNKYVIITMGSDYYFTKQIFDSKPSCVKKIFAQNVYYKHIDLIPIPIGLGPNKGKTAWLPDNNGVQFTDWYENNIVQLRNELKNNNVLYCNWNIENNPNQRKGILKKLKQNNISYYWDRGEEEQILHIDHHQYYINMSKYKFVISPPGNGIDCHRTWEALYMGAMPVVIKHTLYDEFDKLPIIQVDNYSEITQDLLNSYLNKKYNYEKLYMAYWKQTIYNAYNN